MPVLLMFDLVLDFMLDRVHAVTHVALRASSVGRCIELAGFRKGRQLSPVSHLRPSCPRMGAAVDFQQSLGIDDGVELRRR